MAFAKWQDNGPLYLLQCSLRVSGSRLSVSVMKVWILIVGRRGAGCDMDCGKMGGGGGGGGGGSIAVSFYLTGDCEVVKVHACTSRKATYAD